MYTFTVLLDCVLLVQFHETPTYECWKWYEQHFREQYRTMTQFVLVFDLRGITSLPTLDVINAKLKLMTDLKHKSCLQVLATCILISSDTVRNIVELMVRQGGQTAPLYIFSCPRVLAARVARLARLCRGEQVKSTTTPKPTTWGDIPVGARVALFFMKFTSIMQHLLNRKALGLGWESPSFTQDPCPSTGPSPCPV